MRAFFKEYYLMKKICLVFVLSIVSVFSISAQTDNKLNAAANIAENVKAGTETVQPAVADAVKTTVKTPETNFPAEAAKPELKAVTEAKKTSINDSENNESEKKPAEIAPVKKPEAIEPVKKPETTAPTAPDGETVKQIELPAEDAKKTALAEPVKKPAEPVLQAKSYSLGALSTGNPAVDGYIEEFSELYDIDPLLIYAQMSQESSFKARATSSKGASGFMQLMPDTARRFGVTNIYNPKQNIKAGVKYMRFLLDKFGGDVRLALAGYNAGEGSVMKYGNKIPPYRETQNYVAKIMNHYGLIANQTANVAQSETPGDK